MTGALLTVREAADRLGRSRGFVLALVADHLVYGVKRNGRWYVSRDELDAWVNRPSSPTPSPPDEACELCGSWGLGLVTDHCHVCGFTRGVLCRSCNAMEATSPNEYVTRADGVTWLDWRQRCGNEHAQEWSVPTSWAKFPTCGRLGLVNGVAA